MAIMKCPSVIVAAALYCRRIGAVALSEAVGGAMKARIEKAKINM